MEHQPILILVLLSPAVESSAEDLRGVKAGKLVQVVLDIMGVMVEPLDLLAPVVAVVAVVLRLMVFQVRRVAMLPTKERVVAVVRRAVG